MLPKIEIPKYFLTIPSNGDTVEYRPFLVKEEKVLMIAQETDTQSAMMAAMKDVIKACTFNEVDVYSLAMYDLEYILLQIRGKSVGETTNIGVKCDHCDEVVPVAIDLSAIEIKQGEKTENKIQLNDEIGVTLKAPTLKDAERSSKLNKNKSLINEAIISVVESVYDSNEVYPLSQASPKEIDSFIDSLNSQQVLEIQSWVDKLPQLKHEIEFECKNGGHKTKKTLSGLADFFG
jgi:hypothetical protein